jgi:hypothetical protein
MESDNLSHSTLDGLYDGLRSIAEQSVPVSEARQFLVLDGGELPDEALATIRRDFPWVTIERVDPGLDYGAVKARGAALVDSEVAVLCDSDCRYEPDWLKHLLTPFAERPDVEVVAGETAMQADGPYGTAVALVHVFPRYSGETSLQPALFYFANNCAFRTSVLKRVPLPPDLPVYRGQTIVHSNLLREAGVQIWRQPLARSLHRPPLAGDFVGRLYRSGVDAGSLGRLVGDRSGAKYVGGMEEASHRGSRVRNARARARSVFAEDRRRYAYLPLTIPIVAVGVAAYGAGRARAALRPVAPAT